MWNFANPDGNSSPSEEYDRLKDISNALFSLRELMENIGFRVWEGTIENLQLYNNIQSIWYMIDDKDILFTLLKNTPNMTFDQIFDQVGSNQDDIIQECLAGGIICNNLKQITVSSALFPRCFQYAASRGNKTTGLDDGISKGITFFLMTPAKLMSVAYNISVKKIPNKHLFRNPQSPLSSNGIRLTISHPGTNSNIDEEGFDISPGFHTVVALTAKEIIRLPWPYSDCTHVDYEMQKLQKRVERTLGSVPNYQAEHNPTYTQQECRSSCLQRLIFEECKCLSTEIRLPFKNIDPSHLCMVLPLHEVQMFLEPEKYDKLGCFKDRNEFMSQKCSFLHKIINDLACVDRVKSEFTRRKLRGNSDCDCGPACYTYEYEVSTSQSLWPAPGYEMSNMWDMFISDRKRNYNFGTCQEFTDCTTFSRRKFIDSSECKVGDRGDLRFVFTTKYLKNTRLAGYQGPLAICQKYLAPCQYTRQKKKLLAFSFANFKITRWRTGLQGKCTTT